MAKVEEKVVESKNTKSPAKKAEVKKVSEKRVSKNSVPANKKTVEKNVKKEVVKNTNDAPKKAKVEKKNNKGNKTYSTGKRKDAVAKVWIVKGSGKITINGIDAHEYLKRPLLELIINEPFVATETKDQYDVICQVLGGGLSGQAGAIRHGIARALNLLNPVAYRILLKRAGLLTRDSRIVERKKAGLIKARKGQVFKRR